jgi:hypothetical protein
LANNPVTNQPMSPLPEIFGKDTPRSVFDRKRREGGWTPERPSGTVAAVSAPANDMALECPSCRQQGKEGVRIFARDRVGYYCMNEHVWKDLDVLMALQPRKLKFHGKTVIQEGHKDLTVKIPEATIEAAQNKFGDRLSATVGAVLDVIAGDRYILLGETDVKRIQERVTEEVKSPAYIVGTIIALQESAKEQKQTIEKLRVDLRAALSGRGGSQVVNESTVITDLGDELFHKVATEAESHGWDVQTYILQALQLATDGKWV